MLVIRISQSMVNIEKLAEVQEAGMLVAASKKDRFVGTLIQTEGLPAIFYYGERRTLQHTCTNCGLGVVTEFTSGQQMVGFGALAEQNFNRNGAQLDVVGKLFRQYLYHAIDVNGFESYLYQSDPDESKGALLSVAYYRCLHCQAQYLVLYQNQLKEERPPFDPDKILIERILQVEFNHTELLRILNHSQVAAAR